MRKKKEPWKPYETTCKGCGEIGLKRTGKEVYLHEDCKKENHKLIIKRSVLRIKIQRKTETEIHIRRVNSHLVVKMRNCLVCGTEFISKGNHNAVCDRCNNAMENSLIYIVKVYKNPKI
jgi:hypothetical protein